MDKMDRTDWDGPFSYESLVELGTALFARAGIADERARTISEILVEGDLMGHTTHGLQLLPAYVNELERGRMPAGGGPEIVRDSGAAVTWDGGYRPGPRLVIEAMELGFSRIATHPVFTAVIRRSGHIASLASYPKRATDRGLMMLLTCSDPSVQSVAPFGGRSPVYTPNPLAAGIPTGGDPIIIDISMSTTTNGLIGRYHNEGWRLPGSWLLDGEGNPTDDPAAVAGDGAGAVQPLGGPDLGHKGFALGLLVESLTSALAGHGRADQPEQWGASVFLQLIDPEAFGGADAFRRETTWLSEQCRAAAPAASSDGVRMPGQRALELRRGQLEAGIHLYPGILSSLEELAGRFGVSLPSPVT